MESYTRQKKHLLIFSWEFPRVNSSGGAALSRRIGQIAYGFAKKGWRVSVVHKDHIDENIPLGNHVIEYQSGSGEILRYPVKGPEINQHGFFSKFPLLRKVVTLGYTYLYGDRSVNWANEAKLLFKKNHIKDAPDLILGFFTPRGPLHLSDYASKVYGVPWFADLQDPYDDGFDRILKPFIRSWTRRILKRASGVIHVSPEWAIKDGEALGIKMHVLRHAIPQTSFNASSIPTQNEKKTFTLLYAGSLDPIYQPCSVLMSAINTLNKSEKLVELKIAGKESVYNQFKKHALSESSIHWLGWLSPEKMEEEILNANCLVVIPWIDDSRLVVPSKLYEYLGFAKPVLIAGEDPGAIELLLKELDHSIVVARNSELAYKALTKALKGDYSEMLQLEQCKKSPLYENDLIEGYLKIVSSANSSLV